MNNCQCDPTRELSSLCYPSSSSRLFRGVSGTKPIHRTGLPQPGKSACFFCPSSKPREILDLKRNHPDLLARALAMEANAELTSIKGLGRSFSWKELIEYDESQMDMFGFVPEIPCGCFDGEE